MIGDKSTLNPHSNTIKDTPGRYPVDTAASQTISLNREFDNFRNERKINLDLFVHNLYKNNIF